MKSDELTQLLRGAPGATLTFSTPEGPVAVFLDRHALASPAAMRAAFRRQVGWTPPTYSQRDHDRLVRACFQLADAVERDGRAA